MTSNYYPKCLNGLSYYQVSIKLDNIFFQKNEYQNQRHLSAEISNEPTLTCMGLLQMIREDMDSWKKSRHLIMSSKVLLLQKKLSCY